MKTLCVRTQGTFCNRLQTIVSSAMWAEDLGCKMEIYWPVDSISMPFSLEEVLLPESIPSLLRVHAGYLSKAHQVLSEEDMRMVVSMSMVMNDEIRIDSYSEFHQESKSFRGTAMLRQIRINPELESEADKLWKSLEGKSSWTGVWKVNSDTDELKKYYEQKIFLGNPELHGLSELPELYELSSKYALMNKKTNIIDWLLLQKCSKIISYNTLYSEIAVRRSGSEIILI